MKQSEFRRWLESQGVIIKNGKNHLILFHGDARSAMPRHPGKEINEKLRLSILKQLKLK
ncbi:type II toxin-antitoxin system HicA family toxin [Xenorhabdus eapokensis]|uniref:type II toxin-antitoxin system HicA family toxin n=1 Tax=Xenorhabdus eapokensis TaxID=1873482 RepID=UPI00093BED29|nr:type II toxin-antitoxin system HicA family toxin [Xenorhabdus eapokensis]